MIKKTFFRVVIRCCKVVFAITADAEVFTRFEKEFKALIKKET